MSEEENILEEEGLNEEVMPDEEELPNEETSEEEVTEEVVEDEEVKEAKKYGHLSKEEWVAQGRDPNKYKTPEEFNKTAKVIDQLYSLKKKVDQRDREIQALVDYQQRTAKREYERAKKDLESKIAASKDDMDVEGVAHYTQELTRLQDTEEQAQINLSYKMQQEAQQQFIERNQHWFNDRNPDLKQRAIEIDNEIKSVYPNATYEELARKIETRMQYEYPERVLGQVKARPTVTPSQSSVNKTAVNKSSATKTFQSLPQDLKDTYTAHARIRASLGEELTHAEFIERLKKDGEI